MVLCQTATITWLGKLCENPHVGPWPAHLTVETGGRLLLSPQQMLCLKQNAGVPFSSTCPSRLVGQDESFALGVAVANLDGFIDVKHREEAALVMVRWPASVVLIRNKGFRHPPVLCK